MFFYIKHSKLFSVNDVYEVVCETINLSEFGGPPEGRCSNTLPFAYGNLSFRFLRSNHDKVSATRLDLLSAQLPITGTKKYYIELLDNQLLGWF